MTHLALELSTTSTNAFGFPMIKLFQSLTSSKTKTQKIERKRWKGCTYWNNHRRRSVSSIWGFPTINMAPCLTLWNIFNELFLRTSVNNNLISLKELSLAGDGTPVYTLLRNEKLVPAAVWKKVFVTAGATAFTISPTVTLDGIPIVIVITLDTTYTYWLLLILKMICQSSHS